MHENSILVRTRHSVISRYSMLGALEVSQPTPLMHRSLAPYRHMGIEEVVFAFRPQLSAFTETESGCHCLVVDNCC